MNLNIIYEDDAILICNKPAGLMVEPDRNNHLNLLHIVKLYLKQKTGEALPYAQHLHRIDRPVSGIVLFAKKREHLKNLSEQFAQRQVQKFYLAVTESKPQIKSGILEHWHRKEKKKAVLVPEGTEFAEYVKLEFKVSQIGIHFLWKIILHTGKYHQIRVQLASVGCPIIGDALYGSKLNLKPNTIALHAHELKFMHPTSNTLFNCVADVKNTIFDTELLTDRYSF